MIGFWISAGAMVLMVALLLVQALRLGRVEPEAESIAADLAVYRDQLAEVERDLARGVLNGPEADRVRIEVQRRMLEVDRRSGLVPGLRGSGYRVGLLAVLLALGLALALYERLGVAGYPDMPLSLRMAAADEAYQNRPSQAEAEAGQPGFVTPEGLEPGFAEILQRLRAAVAVRPGDLVGLKLLAETEAQVGNFRSARQAQAEVVRLRGEAASGEELALLARVMVLAAGGLVTAEAEAVLIRCLKVDPGNGWARYYSGLMFAQIGRPDRAFALWEPLLREGPGDAPWFGPVAELIEPVAAAAGVAYEAPAPGPDAGAVAAAEAMTEAERAEMIASMVEGLEARLSGAGGTVEEWVRLITALGVLGEVERAKAAFAGAAAAYPDEVEALRDAAEKAGVVE